MNYKILKDQLTRYYTGEISPSELEQLRQALKTDHLPEEFLHDKQIILGLEQTADIDLEDIDMTSELELLIDNEVAKEQKSKQNKWLKPLSIAASIIAITTFSIVYMQPKAPTQMAQFEDSYNSPEEAQQAALQILSFVGGKITNGQKHLKSIEQINQALTPVNSAFSNCKKGIDQINKIIKKHKTP